MVAMVGEGDLNEIIYNHKKDGGRPVNSGGGLNTGQVYSGSDKIQVGYISGSGSGLGLAKKGACSSKKVEVAV